jgi:ferric-dicitrate binding protein FerR (iron transport regulator)
MTEKTLSIERFEALVAAYGADLRRFPEKERAAAEGTLATSARARELFTREAELDAALVSLPAPELSPALARRLAEVPLRAPQRRFGLPSIRWVVPGLGWAAALSFGLWFGTSEVSDEVIGGDESAELSGDTGSLEEDESDLALMLGSLDELEGLP